MLSYLLPVFIGVLIIGYSVGKPYWREYQRKKIKNQPFKKQWRKIIQKRMPYFRKMPAELQLQLKKKYSDILGRKKFYRM